MQLNEWMNEWLEHYVRPAVKVRTYEKYICSVRLHILPTLGNMELNKIRNSELQHLISDLLSRGNLYRTGGLSSNTVNGIINVLKSCFGMANILGYVKSDPTKTLKRPKNSEKETQCFNKQEQEILEIAALNGKEHLIGILISLYTGLRIGELLALEWKDIDFKTGLMHISKTCFDGMSENGKFGRVTYSPKTKSAIRVIPLPQTILVELKRRRDMAKTKYVIEHKGQRMRVRTYQAAFEVLLRKLGLPHRGFHALRHTFATRALESGMDVRSLAEILGHKNPNITLNRYAHSLIEHKTEMMNKLGKNSIINKFPHASTYGNLNYID